MKHGVTKSLLILLLLGRATLLSAQDAVSDSGPVEFNRDVRPILSNHCFQCHGEDAAARKADLRLDVRNIAVDRQVIVPKQPHESSLVSRINSADVAERMPPASANKPLSPRQIAILTQWISEGADYQEHWAFRKVVRPEIPQMPDTGWCRNEIDPFILQRLSAVSLSPSAAADKSVLIRRLYQDLLGLLPSVADVDEFLQDAAPDASEKLVDRLLSNPHYGERWGRHWLDQARYADSNGYTIDGPRVMWPYRDWVINAINTDMPFDQFTIAQLAGDLLPDATTAQKIATAFHRNTMINEEGGVKVDQFRHEALIDRVNTTGAVWLGLTIGCAQCHSHKFDPISHDDYYRLYTFFNACEDANNIGPTVAIHEGELFGWTQAQEQQLSRLRSLQLELTELQKTVKAAPALANLAWNWEPAAIVKAVSSGKARLTLQSDQSLLASVEGAANDTFTVDLDVSPKDGSAPKEITGVRLRTLTDESLPSTGPGTAGNGNFVLTEFMLQSADTNCTFAAAEADHSQSDYPVENAIDGKPGTGWAINTTGLQVAMGIRMNAPHTAIFVLQQPVAALENRLQVVLRHDLNKAYLVGHFAIDVSTARIAASADTSAAAVQIQDLKKQISELESQLPGKGMSVMQMVMSDAAKPAETFVLKRGDFLNPDRDHGALSAGVPQAINPGAAAAFANRLDLARWLVSRDNPLTARVTVNRVWARYFGRGLVETENDFGFQGTPPSHPELLDWLAAEFMESGWSMKHLHRLIVNSATYRQRSDLQPAVTHAAAMIDPGNRLLSRQNRLRVEAEIVRDMAVSAAGLLSEVVGGPGIYLPQPDGVFDFTQNKKDWPTSAGSDRYRRTMYTMFYRSAPYPLLSTFDAPDFSTVCTKRVRSNTPLQSLTVANDPVFSELARGLAARILSRDQLTSTSDRCVEMFRLCLTRRPDVGELELLLNYYSRELSRFESNPGDADSFVNPTATDKAVDLAAWTSVARALFNSDEFVTRN